VSQGNQARAKENLKIFLKKTAKKKSPLPGWAHGKENGVATGGRQAHNGKRDKKRKRRAKRPPNGTSLPAGAAGSKAQREKSGTADGKRSACARDRKIWPWQKNWRGQSFFRKEPLNAQ
jgi:hypothetical protein